MKLTAIKRQCLKENAAVIYEDGMRQWLGTHTACWPVEGIGVEEEAIPCLFDLNVKQQASMDILTKPLQDTMLRSNPDTAVEAKLRLIIEYMGRTIWLMDAEGVMIALEEDKIRTACSEKDYRGITIQKNDAGTPVAIVFDGMIQCGRIIPLSTAHESDIMAAIESVAQMKLRGERHEAMDTGRV